MIDLDKDKYKIISRGRELKQEIKRILSIFEKLNMKLKTQRKSNFLKESRKELIKLLRRFNEYDSYVGQYLNEIATAPNIIVNGETSAWTSEDRQKAHIFSEQVKTQCQRLYDSIKTFQEMIADSERELINTKLLYSSYALFIATIILILPSILKLIDFLSKIISTVN